jgi:HEAT repeat protein
MAWLNTLRLKSSDPQVREKAIEHLAGSNNTRDTERIFASLHDESSQVRCAAVRALEKAPKKDSVRCLVNALRDPSYQVREEAARALGRLRDHASIEPLKYSLRDPDPAVRAAVAGALRALAWKPATREELARFEIALGNVPAAVPTTENDPEPFAAGTRNDTTFQRRAAAEALKELNDPHKIKPLLADLEHIDPGVRISAIHALGRVSSEGVTGQILKRFRDNDPDVRLAAVQVLAERDDAPAAPFLGLLEDANVELRLAAVQFLGRIRNAQIADVLLPLLFDAQASVRRATATALGMVGNVSAVESLVVSLTDDDFHVRQAAEQALDQVDPNWLQSLPTQNARARIVASLAECSPGAQSTLLQVLAMLPMPESAAERLEV